MSRCAHENESAKVIKTLKYTIFNSSENEQRQLGLDESVPLFSGEVGSPYEMRISNYELHFHVLPIA